MKALVAYFSATGTTGKVAVKLAEDIGADLFEIVPERPYTKADLNWMNPLSRCNKEQSGRKVPVAGTVENMGDYDIIFLGFPIWYWGAPNVVKEFLKGYDCSGKKIAIFATSGGSGIGKTAQKVAPFAEGAEIVDAGVFNGATAEEMKAWAEKYLG